MARCVLQLGVLGISFKTADLFLREAFARAAAAFADTRGRFFPYPVVVLSTCERVEFYFSSPDLADAQAHLLSWLKSLVRENFDHPLYTYFGREAFLHLCRVTAGLDSAIVGETEIQRQVKVAYTRAMLSRSLPSSLHYVFQKALRVSKQARSDIVSGPTLYEVVWRVGAECGVDFKEANLLVVGYSEWNRGLLAFLERRGVKKITLCTQLGTQMPTGVKIAWPTVDRSHLKNWIDYEVIFSATQSAGYLLHSQPAKKHLIFDLGVPRNVDPALGKQEGVRLYNIEHLDKKAQKIEVQTEAEKRVAEHSFRLAQLYRFKTLRGRETSAAGSRLECFPTSGKNAEN